jgi:hypothetical protein
VVLGTRWFQTLVRAKSWPFGTSAASAEARRAAVRRACSRLALELEVAVGRAGATTMPLGPRSLNPRASSTATAASAAMPNPHAANSMRARASLGSGGVIGTTSFDESSAKPYVVGACGTPGGASTRHGGDVSAWLVRAPVRQHARRRIWLDSGVFRCRPPQRGVRPLQSARHAWHSSLKRG